MEWGIRKAVHGRRTGLYLSSLFSSPSPRAACASLQILPRTSCARWRGSLLIHSRDPQAASPGRTESLLRRPIDASASRIFLRFYLQVVDIRSMYRGRRTVPTQTYQLVLAVCREDTYAPGSTRRIERVSQEAFIDFVIARL